MTSPGTVLTGRESELSRLSELVSPPYADSRMLLVLGEAGTGKTALLKQAQCEARSAGMRVIAATGRQSESDLAFAGLHQLLRPVLGRVDGLPVRQAQALRGAFAISNEPVPPDALLTGIAVLTLLSALSEDQPLLVVVDDAQWLDSASLDAVVFAARRLESEQLVLIFAARGDEPPAGLDRDFPQPLLLPPLSAPDAGRLLDSQPRPPRGQAREQVLAQAAGNPLALIELSAAIAADPQAGRRWASEPLPLTSRLTSVMAARFAALPEQTRTALLLAATADTEDLALAVPGLTPEALGPAEAAGLVKIDQPAPRFTHPLVRAAVYHAVPFAERAAAHKAIADAYRDQPDRYAWHLAAAALEPDEHLAALLEDSAARAQRRGGAAAAARALERAAQLSPGEDDSARRLLAAAALALSAGQTDWVRDLAGKALAQTSDPDLRLDARLHIGWSQVWSNRNADAIETLIPLATEAAPRRPALAWEAVGMAAATAHQTGLPEACEKVLGVLAILDGPGQRVPAAEGWQPGRADEIRIWARTCVDPFSARAELVPYLHRIVGSDVTGVPEVAGAAWVLDETEVAVRMLREALSRLRAPGVRGASGGALVALQGAYLDSGRWDDALAAALEASDIAAAYKMENVAATADLTTATVLAMRGDLEQVPPLLARALAAVDIAEFRSFAVKVPHTAGIAALARGDYVTACAHLSRLFSADGTAVHRHYSYLGIADLAAAAARAERRLEVKTLTERAMSLIGPDPGPRFAQLAARARGLLAEPADAGGHFAAALADPTGETWPFERAQLRLDYGEWLRRQRRINNAKPVLSEALAAFRRLRAAPWTRRTETELRACGVTAQTAPPAPGAIAELTAQQREIVVLASRGLSNAEIADRLFLSPRTVASHLYRTFPKLGISDRHQLRDLIDEQHAGPAA
jgi:DNA-binding CsgD family transcriptional regulator